MKYPIHDFGALFDAHVHTYFDYHDGFITPTELIRCTKQRGFNWVCAMAHDTAVGAKKIAKLAKEQGIPCLSGIEISTTHNHLLAYGIDHWPYLRNTVDPEVAIEELRKQDCAIFIAHPYANPLGVKGGTWSPQIVARLDIDGIEWCNATTYFLNTKTQQIYHDFPKGRRIAGTDAHHPSNFGYAFTQVMCLSEDSDDLVSAMQKGKCKAHSHNVPLFLAGYGAFLSIVKNKLLKQRIVEGHPIIAQGDLPYSIYPSTYNGPFKPYEKITKAEKDFNHGQWMKNFMQYPFNSRTSHWLSNRFY